MRKALLVAALAALAPAAIAAPVSFRGLDVDALGSASALIWSPRSNVAEMRCENIGSSGQDGVLVATPQDCDAWTGVFGDLPPGASAPEAFALALHETNDPGLPPFATYSFEPVAGRLRCVVDVPEGLGYAVEVWSGNTLVHSSTSASPPVVDLPASVAACQPGSSVGVVTNTRQRLQELEMKLIALGLLSVNGVAVEGDRVRLLTRCPAGKHFSKVTLTARYSGGGGGGGGAGGFSVRSHSPRFGIGGDPAPASPLGFVVDDGNVLTSPPAPGTGCDVQLGAGLSSWSVSYDDLSRPGSLLRRWGMDVEPVSASALAAGAQLECRVPSSWSDGPDTTGVTALDENTGTGPVLRVTGSALSRSVTVVAYSGDAVVHLAQGPPSPPLDLSLSEAPTGFHATTENGDVVVRCPLPPGVVVFSGGMIWPCDSVEVRVRGAAGEACDGLQAATLTGREINQRNIPSANFLHMHQHGRLGAVSVSASGDAVLQPYGGGLVVHGLSVTGGDGVVLHGGGGALRVKLKDTFQNGDIPDQQDFTAQATLSDGTSEDVSSLALVYTPGADGAQLGMKVHCLHRGEGKLFVQLGDSTVWEPGDCDDDDDGYMDFRQVLAGGTSMVGSVGYRRDSPWTEIFDVEFTGPVRVTVRGEDRDILGLRVWRNRGGEAIGTPAPPVSAMRVDGRPPAVPVLGQQGVCGLEIEGVELHSAGAGIEALGPNSTIEGEPVVATWVTVQRDTTGGPDDDCDGDSGDDGITLLSKGGYTPVVIDKKFPRPGPLGPVHRGLALTSDFGPVDAMSDSASVEMVAGGSVLGAPTDQLYRYFSKKGYDYYQSQSTMAAATSPLVVRCYLLGALVAEFEHPDSLELTQRPGAVVIGDLDRDGRPDLVLAELPPGTQVRSPVGGCCTDQDCDRVVISPGAGYDASALDGTCRVTLNGLPPGVPVRGVRLATILDADPTLGVVPLGAGRAFALARPWPNPARGALRARFALPAAAQVRARVFDVAGRVVATLADARFAPGEHELAWDGRADGGGLAPAGLYFLRVTRDGREGLSARFTRLR